MLIETEYKGWRGRMMISIDERIVYINSSAIYYIYM
jgi:hypothetical protein